MTKSHLRFGRNPIHSTYLVSSADFVACHNPSYIERYDIVSDVKPGGAFLLNCAWDLQGLEENLPASVKRQIADKKIRFYTLDATGIAQKMGLGGRINTLLQSAFFKISEILPIEDAVRYMKDAIKKTYGSKGDKVLNMNYDAVDRGIEGLVQVEVPASWSALEPEPVRRPGADLPRYIREVLIPVNALKGDDLPVSTFVDDANGTVPLGTSKYEKRGTAINVPQWIPENCIQCNQCAFVCPHASIRPFLLDEGEKAVAPKDYITLPGRGKGLEGYGFRIQVDPLDCVGCGSCAETCPARNKALVMKPLDSQLYPIML